MKIPQSWLSAARLRIAPWACALPLFALSPSLEAAAQEQAAPAQAMFKQYCIGCHGQVASGGVSLQKLLAEPRTWERFREWDKVAGALEQKHMPPSKMPQPGEEQRQGAVAWIRANLKEYAQTHAGDPGAVTVRRLTSAEYGYSVKDLTRLDVQVDRDFVSDAVGGEGFTNFGDIQFMEEANLERYLEMAKNVAAHAIVGAGPLSFFEDPGKSGFEMSAIQRIQKIYEENGFRAVAGEGGRAFGLDMYSKAFFVAWRYRNRKTLGQPDATLSELARKEGISPRFAQHIWSVVNQPSAPYPMSDVLSRWKALPAPPKLTEQQARARAGEIQKYLVDWPRWVFAAGELAAGGQGDERAQVLTEASLKPTQSFKFRYVLRNRDQKRVRVFLSLVPLNPSAQDKPAVVWRNPMIRFGRKDRSFGPAQPLAPLLDEENRAMLKFGLSLNGAEVAAGDFATLADGVTSFDVVTPQDALGAELQVEAVVGPSPAGDAVLRCTISDREEAAQGRPVWVLLGNPQGAGYLAWRSGVMQFAHNLPQNSQGEAAPSDKDQIPEPFDNTYNQPERDLYHVKVKYYRDDRFLVEKVLDDATRARLETAWSDLKSSFEYHNAYFQFVVSKYKLNLNGKGIADVTPAEIAALPAEPRRFAQELRADYDAVQAAQKAARPGHVADCLRLASEAWRRPLSESEKEALRSFYANAKDAADGDHSKAIRALVARVLVSPEFLYRLESPTRVSGIQPVPAWDLASRLSYFLWSSLPDKELRRAAAAGDLENPQLLQRQVKRMLADPKARRMATEFFGQWLGFYRFDQYRGVDTTRFPEFTDDVKNAMYEEAVSFFEHVVRNDRPVREILSADYTFLNQALAKHYGVKQPVAATGKPELVSGANAFQRGGALRLGAVLTLTSAPLRTSPVKRGDWVLRRVLGTPTPPPPADAGTIPGDDKSFGGLTVAERLKAHQRNATCAGCHSRIDPLGFPLESYDAVGRWRDQYADGKPVQDSSTTADQQNIAGVDGLVQYLGTQQPQVLKTMSNKLLGYALGRTVLASDQPLVEKLVQTGSGASFSQWVSEIAMSRQFRSRRAPELTKGPPKGAPDAGQKTKLGEAGNE